MDRIITLDAQSDYISKDEKIIRFAMGTTTGRYRMRDVLKWARDNGFTRKRAYRRESARRAYNLIGTGEYEGWTIQCLNRSHSSVQADYYQERAYTVFYRSYQIGNYFPANGLAYSVQQPHLIDLLLEGLMPALIKDRPRLMNRYAHFDAETQIVLTRAA